MTDFEQKCNAILDDPNILEEDKVDLLDQLVRETYVSMKPENIEKKIMDILWKHRDPSRLLNRKPDIVKVEVRQMKVEIPDFERRLELEKQFLELERLNEVTKRKDVKRHKERDAVEKEYNTLLKETETLRKELYGDKPISSETRKVPLAHISELFEGSVSERRIEQALKSSGYDLIEAISLIISQLKRDESPKDLKETSKSELSSSTNISAGSQSDLFFAKDIKTNILCSFLVKTGKCLRSDCRFSHDLDVRICKYWLKGSCLMGDNCMFKHDLSKADNSNVDQASAHSNDTELVKHKPFNFKASLNSNAAPFVPSAGSKVIISKPLKKPQNLPWDLSLPSEIKTDYIKHRNLAKKAEINRKKFAQLSTDAWKTNNGAKSKQLSDKATKQEDVYYDELKLADDVLFSFSETTDDEIWFEMHGLAFNEAIEQLSGHLNDVKSRKHKGSVLIYLVVPAPSQVSDYKLTTKPLTLWLDHEGYRWQIYNYGDSIYGSVIVLDPHS